MVIFFNDLFSEICYLSSPNGVWNMSGHSKWSSIKHKKAAIDAKRGKVFFKVIKEITVAARLGGGDADANPRLRTAISIAKSANMPADNIERAIKKGMGDLPGQSYEEQLYEGYAVAGIAVMVEVLTDNKNRTAAEIRHVFSRHGGSLAGSGSVSWIFEKKGLITIEKSVSDEEQVFTIATDAGADDFSPEGELFEIQTDPTKLEIIKAPFESEQIPIARAILTYIPKNTVKVEGADAKKVLNLLNALEDHDDVQNVYANFDMPDDLLDA